MGFLNVLGQGQGFLKAGFLGFPKSGKTTTAAYLACGLRKMLDLKGPIAMADTEGGSEYIAPLIERLTGQKLLGVKTRAFSDLVGMARECEKEGVSVLIADSMTHFWRELCDAHLAGINDFRRKKGWELKKKLEFQDWGILKNKWNEWTDLYLNGKLHCIIAGRAGFEYDFQENDDGKKELVKTGVKMKTESEFGFEPSLLVEMERVQDMSGDKTVIYRQATVIGDRFGVIDGRLARFNELGSHEKNMEAVLRFFRPHLDLLTPGAHTPIDTSLKTDTGANEEGDDAVARRRKERQIVLEEIEGEMLRRWPGQTKEEKLSKSNALETYWGTRSWSAVEKRSVEELRSGLASLRGLPDDCQMLPPEPSVF